MTLKIGTQTDRNGLAVAQRFAIKDHLDVVLTKCPGNEGFVTYAEGHDDRTVAEAMPFPCTVSNVSGMRVAMFGRLREKSYGPPPELLARVEALEAQAATFERAVEDLYDRLSHLRAEVRREPATISA